MVCVHLCFYVSLNEHIENNVETKQCAQSLFSKFYLTDLNVLQSTRIIIHINILFTHFTLAFMQAYRAVVLNSI